jgi:hypothetical protein
MPVEQQMHDFLERRIDREIVDIVTAIGETPDVAFNVTEHGLTDDDPFETPVH